MVNPAFSRESLRVGSPTVEAEPEPAPRSGSALTSARGAQSESVKQEPVQQEPIKQEPVQPAQSEESSDEPEPIKQPKPKQRMSKQDARQLLKQLNDMFSDDDDEPQSYTQQPRNWNRRRLKF